MEIMEKISEIMRKVIKTESPSLDTRSERRKKENETHTKHEASL